jgi:hypothetical protein
MAEIATKQRDEDLLSERVKRYREEGELAAYSNIISVLHQESARPLSPGFPI